MEALAGESMARNKYTYYASKARKEGYVQIAELFEETAANEKEHAKIWFKLLHDGIGSTPDNLKDAAERENFEWTDMYDKFAKEAYRKLLQNIEDGIVFSGDGDTIWKCKNCGYIVIGSKAPEVCPVCSHPRSYFEIKAENY